jgi:hypothetical protein
MQRKGFNRNYTIIFIHLFYRLSKPEKIFLKIVKTLKALSILSLYIANNTFLSKLLQQTRYYVLHSTKYSIMFALSKQKDNK